MKTSKNILIFGVIVLFLVTFSCALTYLVTQQTLRMGANQLPAQLAKETSIKLQNGQSAKNAVPAEKLDISESLGTFVMVYDHNQKLVATSGMMGNREPVYPKGTFDYVAQKGENRVTWQPQPGLRFATVVRQYGDQYIVAGRSLFETEKLIDLIGRLVLWAWLACTVFLAMALGILHSFIKKF